MQGRVLANWVTSTVWYGTFLKAPFYFESATGEKNFEMSGLVFNYTP
jgi:hypothetical protein